MPMLSWLDRLRAPSVEDIEVEEGRRVHVSSRTCSVLALGEARGHEGEQDNLPSWSLQE